MAIPLPYAVDDEIKKAVIADGESGQSSWAECRAFEKIRRHTGAKHAVLTTSATSRSDARKDSRQGGRESCPGHTAFPTTRGLLDGVTKVFVE